MELLRLFFLTKLYEGESAQSKIGKAIQMAIELGKIQKRSASKLVLLLRLLIFFGLQGIIGF